MLSIPYPENSIATIIIIIKINFLFILKINKVTKLSKKRDNKNKYISLQKGKKLSFV